MPAAGAAAEAPVLGEADRSWRAAADLVDRTRAGRGGALVVRGQAVGGKSALADRAERYARELGVRVLRIPAPQLVRRFGGLGRLVAELAPVRKGLSSLHDDLLGAVLDQPLAIRDCLALRGAVVALLGAAAAEAPLLLIADDADDLDEATRTVLEYAAHRFARAPLGLLATETSAVASRIRSTAASETTSAAGPRITSAVASQIMSTESAACLPTLPPSRFPRWTSPRRRACSRNAASRWTRTACGHSWKPPKDTGSPCWSWRRRPPPGRSTHPAGFPSRSPRGWPPSSSRAWPA